MITLKASTVGHEEIKRARLSKGWPVNDFRWVAAASKLLGTDWEVAGVLAVGISEGTWKRFLAGKAAINADAFKAYCQVLDLDWKTVIEGDRPLAPALPGQDRAVATDPHPRRLNPCAKTGATPRTFRYFMGVRWSWRPCRTGSPRTSAV